jgi:hypothetical protein
VDPFYDPETLKIGTTYYWRVDEFVTGYRKGDVWSFTTVPEIAVTNPDLLGWWTLDEGMGITAVDWSGHGKHGRIVGDAKWTHGVHDGALYLSDGASVESRRQRDNQHGDDDGLGQGRQPNGRAACSLEESNLGMGFSRPTTAIPLNDKCWDFATGIVPPQEWFFMPLVVEPTQGLVSAPARSRNKVPTRTRSRNPAHRSDPQGRDEGLWMMSAHNSRRRGGSGGHAGDVAGMEPAPAPDAVMDIRDVSSWLVGGRCGCIS